MMLAVKPAPKPAIPPRRLQGLDLVVRKSGSIFVDRIGDGPNQVNPFCERDGSGQQADRTIHGVDILGIGHRSKGTGLSVCFQTSSVI